jgi:hypothetical protein
LDKPNKNCHPERSEGPAVSHSKKAGPSLRSG